MSRVFLSTIIGAIALTSTTAVAAAGYALSDEKVVDYLNNKLVEVNDAFIKRPEPTQRPTPKYIVQDNIYYTSTPIPTQKPVAYTNQAPQQELVICVLNGKTYQNVPKAECQEALNDIAASEARMRRMKEDTDRVIAGTGRLPPIKENKLPTLDDVPQVTHYDISYTAPNYQQYNDEFNNSVKTPTTPVTPKPCIPAGATGVTNTGGLELCK